MICNRQSMSLQTLVIKCPNFTYLPSKIHNAYVAMCFYLCVPLQVYDIYIDGTFHCSVRYSQLLNLHEEVTIMAVGLLVLCVHFLFSLEKTLTQPNCLLFQQRSCWVFHRLPKRRDGMLQRSIYNKVSIIWTSVVSVTRVCAHIQPVKITSLVKVDY